MATEYIIGLQPPKSVKLTPNSNLLELVLITERVNKIRIVGKEIQNDEILSAVLFNGDDIDLRVRDDPIGEDVPLIAKEGFQNYPYIDVEFNRHALGSLGSIKSLDLSTPFVDRIAMQQTCYSASDQPDLFWRRITYLKIDLGGQSIEIGCLRQTTESVSGQYIILPEEIVQGPCMISGIGMHNTDLICLQVISLAEKGMAPLKVGMGEHLYAYGKSSVGLVNLKRDILKPVEETNFAAIEPSDPDVMSIINHMSGFMFNWYSSRSSIHRVFPDLYHIIDKAVTENDRSVIFAVFRLHRHLRWRISNEVKRGHSFDRDPFVRLKIFKVVDCLANTLEMCQRFIVNKPSVDCYSVAFLSGDVKDMLVAALVLITQIGLTFMLLMSVIEADLGQIVFFPGNIRFVITPVITIFSAMLVYKQISNSLATFHAYPGMQTSLMGLFEIIANGILGVIVLIIQLVIIAKSDDNVEYVLNSIAAIFILELDDNVVFLDDDGITDLNRRLLMRDFNRRIKEIDDSYFKYMDWRTARNSHQIMNNACELKPLPPIQFTSSNRSITSTNSKSLEVVGISFSDEQLFSYALDGWAEIATSTTIVSSKLTKESKATLQFTWRDQGWGNRKGKLRVRLIHAETGEDVASTPEYGIAPHEYTTVNEHFGFNHGLVRNSIEGYRFVVEVVVGGGGGHELYVKDFHFECTAGLVHEASVGSNFNEFTDDEA